MTSTIHDARSQATWGHFAAACTTSDFTRPVAAGRSHPELRDAKAGREPVVVLMLTTDSASTATIVRSVRVASALNARLVAVMAIPERANDDRPARVAAHVSNVLTRIFPLRGYELTVRPGSPVDLAIEVGTSRSPLFVIVGSGWKSRPVSRIVDALEVPVLVSRDPHQGGELIGASDMTDDSYPVLSEARSLADALGRSLVYFHNARPASLFSTDPLFGPASYARMFHEKIREVATKRTELEEIAPPEGVSTVVREANTVTALLELARDRDADIIVVGQRPRSRFARILGMGIAERLVEQSPRSVLVVPLTPSS